MLRIPAADPGNVIGWEYELEERPLFIQDIWQLQHFFPVRESHYSLQLPAGWEYRAAWLNYTEVKPTQAGNNRWEWAVNDVQGIRGEPQMPPVRGLAGQMIVYLFPPGGTAQRTFDSWDEMGR